MKVRFPFIAALGFAALFTACQDESLLQQDGALDHDADLRADTDSAATPSANSHVATDSAPPIPEDIDSLCHPDWGVYDAGFGVCWKKGAGRLGNWHQALAICDDLTLGGHGDWTLPTRQDFVNLLGGCDDHVRQMQIGRCDKCFGDVETRCAALFHDAPDWTHTPTGWTSDTFDDREDVAWMLLAQMEGQLKELAIHFTCLRRVL